MMNDTIEIKWRDCRVYLSLQQMQQIISGISADYTNNELCSMLDLFIADNDRKSEEANIRTFERQIDEEKKQEYKSE